MNKILLCFLLASVTSWAQTRNEESIFENYKFGTSPLQYKDLVLEIDEGDTKLYTREKPLSMNGVEFEQVHVTFRNNKLSSISIKTKNATGTKFFQVLKEKYGEPGKSNAAKGHYEWKNNALQLHYEKIRSTQDAAVSFYCVVPNKNGKK